MTLQERLRQLAAALPSDGSVTFTRTDLVALLEEEPGLASAGSTRDLTVVEVGAEVGRAPSTIRGWLIDGELPGYKLSGRDWRITRSALREYLDGQASEATESLSETRPDITAWRTVQRAMNATPGESADG